MRDPSTIRAEPKASMRWSQYLKNLLWDIDLKKAEQRFEPSVEFSCTETHLEINLFRHPRNKIEPKKKFHRKKTKLGIFVERRRRQLCDEWVGRGFRFSVSEKPLSDRLRSRKKLFFVIPSRKVVFGSKKTDIISFRCCCSCCCRCCRCCHC